MKRIALIFVAACAACSGAPKHQPECGRDTTISVTPAGGGDSARVVRLTPVCEGEDVRLDNGRDG